MMLDVHYGCGVQHIRVPDTCTVEVLEGKEVPNVDQDKVLRNAIDHPLGSTSLDDFLDVGKLLVIVNDGDRPTPTPMFLKFLVEKIENRPNTKILVACGTHRLPNTEDLHLIFGNYYDRLKDKVSFHQAKDKENLVRIGKTKRGNEIFMNKLVTWADKLLITGSVEPHYFAGFTGGRKWVIGVSGFESIERNHKLSLKDQSTTLALKGNPLHEELVEWDRLVDKPKFCINVILDKNMAISSAFAGNIENVFEELVKVGLEFYSVPTKGEADIVLTVSRAPQDSNLYQALKAQEHGKLAMRDGGILILVAECRHGIGPSHFASMMKGVDVEEMLRHIETEFQLGQHKIAKLLNALMRGKVWVVTDVAAEDMAAVHMDKFQTVQEALDKAISIMGPDARIIFLPDGGMIVPHIQRKIKARTGPARPVRRSARSARRSKIKGIVKRTAKKLAGRARSKLTKRVVKRVLKGVARVRKAKRAR